MPLQLFSKVKDIFSTGGANKKKKVFHNVKLDSPEEIWEIIGELGDGAYGKVYKAQHRETGELAALKQVALEGEDDLEAFMIEIDILTEFDHVNVVKLLEAYHYDGKLWMYLEFCDGGAVDSIMVDLDRPLTEPQIAFICKELVQALVYIHKNKVIHRDMKAGNVLLTSDGGVKLADFGVSAQNKNTLDKRGTFIGTPYWLAPEVILCETFIDAQYDYKADIWSLGISLIEFAQMDPPNHDVSPVRVMLKIQKSDPPRLDYPSRFSKEFNDFISKCLTKDPALRPSSSDLLKHPFINRHLDIKPIRDLLLEYHAEVVEEDIEESEEEHRPKSPESISSKKSFYNPEDPTTPTSLYEKEPPKLPILSKVPEVPSDKSDIKVSPTQNNQNSSSPKKEGEVVISSGPSIVDDEVSPAEIIANTPVLTPPGSTSGSKPGSPAPGSLSEAEEQAVRMLESVIDNAVDDVNRSTGELISPESPLSPLSLGEDSPQKEDAVTNVTVVSSDGVVEVPTSKPADQCLKLDTSEVVISNASIIHNESDTDVELPKLQFKAALQDVADTENQSKSQDPSNISVVSVDTKVKDSHLDSTPVIVLDMNQDSEGDHDRDRSRGNKVASLALTIEGTTVGATDVDDDTFDSSNKSPAKSICDTPTKLNPSICEIREDESEVSICSEASTPTHPFQNSNSTNSSNKYVPNGVEKDHRMSEKSDSDSISTVSSDKDAKHVNDGEHIQYRARKPDHYLRPNDRAQEYHNKRTKEENELILYKKTRKRTRKFVIDGVLVTTTTSKVIYGEDEDTGTLATGHMARKQELRELKILQKLEQKQFQELALKANFAKQEQEKKFEVEKTQLVRGYDNDVEILNRQQKQQVERAEGKQELEMKNASKRIRIEQEKELKSFRESLKTELKLLKQEIDLLPKDKRKEALKVKKERLELDQSEREKGFLESLHETHEMSLKRLSDDHRESIALLERQFLQQKHQMFRSRESALWEMEERHLHDKHQLAKKQLKDIFFLQRHQMLLRHEKELETVKRVNQQKEEELIKRQQIEKRQLPKRIRQEMKARELMFRESMRISTSQLPSHEDEKEKIKKFKENETRRYEAEKKRAEQKHKRQLEELQAASDFAVKELEQLQNEKRKMLTEHETYKLKSQDEEYQKDMRQWKENLKPRKQKLEEEFERQLSVQENFYGGYLNRSLSSATPAQSTSSLARSITS